LTKREEKIRNLLLVFSVVCIVFMVCLGLMILEQSLRPSLLVIICCVIGLISAHDNINLNLKIKQTLLENALILLILMVLTRMAYLIATFDLSVFYPTSFLLSFLGYFFVAFIVSILVYYLKGEL